MLPTMSVVRIVLSRLPANGAEGSSPLMDRYSAKRIRPLLCSRSEGHRPPRIYSSFENGRFRTHDKKITGCPPKSLKIRRLEDTEGLR